MRGDKTESVKAGRGSSHSTDIARKTEGGSRSKARELVNRRGGERGVRARDGARGARAGGGGRATAAVGGGRGGPARQTADTDKYRLAGGAAASAAVSAEAGLGAALLPGSYTR